MLKIAPWKIAPNPNPNPNPNPGKTFIFIIMIIIFGREQSFFFWGEQSFFFWGGQFSCQPEKLNLMKNVFVSDKSIIFFNIVFLTLHFIDN